MAYAVDVTVTGRVQGVAFRYHAQGQARRLGVTGWVRNEPDGSVVAHLEGEEAAVGRWSRGAVRARRTPGCPASTCARRSPLERAASRCVADPA